MPAPRVVTALLAALLILPMTARAAAPRPGVFAGTLGVKVPKGGHARVRAIDAASSVVVASKDVGRSGAFSLRLPAGAYVVRGVVLPRRGAVVTKSTAVSLKPGQRRTGTKLTARKKTRKKRARAAYVTERGNVRLGSVAAGIYPFSFSGPSSTSDLALWSGGFDDLLINDVLEGAGKRCPGHVTLREVARLADVLREFELGKSRYADKSTFPQRNLIILDVAVHGTVTEAADGTARVTLTITNDRTGANLGAIEAPLDLADVYAGEEKVAGQLTDKLCALSETFEVTLDVNGAGHFATHDASGTMHAVLLARRSGDEWTASGPLQWQNVGFTPKTECPYVDMVVPAITWSVNIADAGDGLTVTWSRDGNDTTTASVDCPPGGPDDPDPPPIPGQVGTSLVNTGPGTFTLPYTGGTTPISGIVQDSGDGFFNDGTINVKPIGITAPS
jgi:hypothetical protein